MEFVVNQLQNDPKVEYRVVKELATAKGLPIYPIMYGRAKALLGLVPTAPRGSKKKAAAEKAERMAQRAAMAQRATPFQRTTRARKGSESMGGTALDSLEQMLGQMREVAHERDRFQQALKQIGKIIEESL